MSNRPHIGRILVCLLYEDLTCDLANNQASHEVDLE